MIILITGLPGASKTLFTLYTVEKRRKADNKAFHDEWVAKGSDPDHPPLVRQVFYFQINIIEGMLPWYKLEKIEDWLDKPAGSIFVIDEAQDAFEPMANSAVRPRYYKELSKHRHRGFDFYMMTQHPTFVDTYVRKNTQQHNHLMRSFGRQKSVVHQWNGVRDNCDKTRKDSIASDFAFPKYVYNWYKSAEVHTHKFSMPLKVWLMFLIPPAFAVLVYFAYDWAHKRATVKPVTPATTQLGQLQSGVALSSEKKKPVFEPASFRPRIDDLPWTAPRYDDLTVATVAPQIVGCIVFQGMCKCLTQQGTTHYASMQFCLATLENGIFQDFGPLAGGAAAGQSKNDQQAPQIQPVVRPVPPPSPEPQKVAVADSGFNLPVSTAQQLYDQKFSTYASGNIYYKK